MARKLFYLFDMVLLGLLLFSIGHTMFRENIIIDTILDIALVLRISIPFLLYRNEKLAILPIIAFCILFGVVIYTNTFSNTILNMGKFPSIVFNTEPLVDSYAVIERPITGMAIMRGIIYWIWLIPLAVYVIQLACKQTKSNGYPWYYLIGGFIFHDKIGITFLRMAILLTIAYFIGYEMQEHLSFLALIAIPLTCYYFWNKHSNRKPHWLEYVVIFAGLFIFDKAQYKVDEERIIYLIASAVVIFAVCCWLTYKSQNILIPLLAFFMAAFLLPSVSLGYNVYQSIEGARANNYVNVGLNNNNGYMYIKRNEVINGKKLSLMGVRDRYRTTIPCEYSFVVPTKLYSPFANCVKFTKGKRHTIVRNVEEGYILE